MIYVALTEKEASALRRSAPHAGKGSVTASHRSEHEKAVQKIIDAENGWAQANFIPLPPPRANKTCGTCGGRRWVWTTVPDRHNLSGVRTVKSPCGMCAPVIRSEP